VAKKGIVGAVSGSHPIYDFLTANGLEVTPELYAYLDTGARDKDRILELIPDSFVEKLCIAGSVDECAGQVAALVEAGIDHPLLAPIPVEAGGELEILRQVSTRIMPELRRVKTA
jgi:alkanesulfonate monooxygenase SsuD/methylene tetrahydromethanopterin reductase-like flavin-dependent oxidoreductase (luciferase family)